MIIIGFVSIVKDIVAKKLPGELEFYWFSHFLSTNMHFQNVGMVTIATIELIPLKI